MKKIVGMALFLLFIGLAPATHAQAVKHAANDVKKGAKKAGQETAKGAKKVGNKTAELASKGKSKVVDQTYKDKVGPDGQTVYIDGDSRYYWVDKKGHKQYVSESALKSKN